MNIDMSGSRLSKAIKRLGITSGELEVSDIKYAYRVDADGMIVAANGEYTMGLGGEENGTEYSASAVGTMETKYSNFGTTKEIEISGTYKDDSDLLKVLKKKYDTTDFVVVAIQKTETKEKLYGMTETDFMKYAKEMESRFEKI